jgi:Fe-S cluster biosynthesis and repair protein YggX
VLNFVKIASKASTVLHTLERNPTPREAGTGLIRWLVMATCGGPTQPNTPASNATGRTVFCQKFQKEMPGLDAPPWPGELGQRVFENVSAEAWKMWEERMKMILNEYRLMPWQKEAQELVRKQMEDFFFGEEAALPPGYVPQQSK